MIQQAQQPQQAPAGLLAQPEGATANMPQQTGGAETQQVQQPQQGGKLNQAMMKKIQIDLTKLIHSKKTAPAILNAIKKKGGDAKAVTDVASAIIDRLEAEYGSIPPREKLATGSLALSELFKTANAAGVAEMPDKETITRAMGQLVKDFTTQAIQKGEATPEEIQAATQGKVLPPEQGQEMPQSGVQGIPPQQQQQGMSAQQQPQQQQWAQGGGQPIQVRPKRNPLQQGQLPQGTTQGAGLPQGLPPQQDPIHPTVTMSQRLAQGGLLDG